MVDRVERGMNLLCSHSFSRPPALNMSQPPSAATPEPNPINSREMDKDSEMTPVAATREETEAQFDPTLSSEQADAQQAQEQTFSTTLAHRDMDMDVQHAQPSDSEGSTGADDNMYQENFSNSASNSQFLDDPRSSYERGPQTRHSNKSKQSHASPTKRKAGPKSNRGPGGGQRRFEVGANGLDDDFGGREEPVSMIWEEAKLSFK